MATIAAPATAYRKPASARHIVGRVLFWLLIIGILFYTIFPFYWAIVTSFKPAGELFDTPVAYWPKTFTFENYASVLGNPDFLRALRNSAITAISTVVLSLLIGSLAAYALGRLAFRGKTLILYVVLAMSMFPAIAILGSLYQMVVAFGLYNRIPALILAYLTFTLPFTIWVLTNFFRSMPLELEEAAFVDGATPMQTFRMVLLPLAAPGMVTTGLLAFIAAWNEYLFALTFTQDYAARTVPVAIASLGGRSQFELPWANIMAASVIVTIPLIVLVLIFQRRIIAGLTAGAVKG
jgi:trehalose/maltose transport system permease protein